MDTNEVRSTAYQAHFRDVWDKMEDFIEEIADAYPIKWVVDSKTVDSDR
jgi:hypothetical protein